MAEEITASSESPAKTRGPKLAAERALPNVGAEQLVRIIKGYAVASNGGEEQVNYKDVASATGLNPTVVSANNTFLAESEIIASPKYGYYVPNEEAVRFAREAAWDEENAKSHLRKVALGTWYGQVAMQNFATRSALSRDELRRVLGIKSGASEADSKALSYIIDFLIYLGVVVPDENDSMHRGNIDELGRQVQTTVKTSEEVRFPAQAVVTSNGSELVPPGVLEGRPPSIVLNLNFSVTLEELTQENARRLRDWISLVITDQQE